MVEVVRVKFLGVNFDIVVVFFLIEVFSFLSGINYIFIMILIFDVGFGVVEMEMFII